MYHIHISRTSHNGQVGQSRAVNSIDYICREGRFVTRGDKVRLVQPLNMPCWARNNIRDYWDALDKQKKRSNARLFFCIEFAIPRELSVLQQNQLVLSFASTVASMSAGQMAAGPLPVFYGIHEGIHKDDDITGRQPNPHAHFMVSTSISDGVLRPASSWFHRANRLSPAAGGAPRSGYIGTRRWLLSVRETWARIANAALKAAGSATRLDHRSNRDRGLASLPTKHLGPKAAAAARAGRPSPKAQRNDRIRGFNKWIAMARRQRQMQALRPDLLMPSSSAMQLVHESDLREAQAELIHELNIHPLAEEVERLSNHASLLLCAPDPSTSATGLSKVDMDVLFPKLRAILVEEWQCVRHRGRLWWLHLSRGDAIVVGRDFVATDATADGTGALSAQIAAALQMSRVVVHADGLESRERDVVEGVLVGQGIEVVRNEQRGANRLKPRLR